MFYIIEQRKHICNRHRQDPMHLTNELDKYAKKDVVDFTKGGGKDNREKLHKRTGEKALKMHLFGL